MFDPKYEFCDVDGVECYNEIEDIERKMFELVCEMQERVKSRAKGPMTMLIIDEFADAIAQARSGKALNGERSLEESLRILAQKGRSVGYRIVAATQRASTKIITGDTKVNFPVQVCFRVPKAVDSNVVINEDGAETLAGHGDGLMKSPEYLNTVRFQGFYYN
jgi:DNA segregation ATPase FtsK/SpoIIIE-like protein